MAHLLCPHLPSPLPSLVSPHTRPASLPLSLHPSPLTLHRRRTSLYQRCLRDLEIRLREAKLWPPRLRSDGSAIEEPPPQPTGEKEGGL